MSLLYLVILAPFLFATIVPLIYKYARLVHTGWFVLIVPILLFVYLLKCFTLGAPMQPMFQSVPWISSLHIDFSIHLDSLGLLFALIITGIGALVVLYSIFYMSKDREALHLFYVYLLMFMGAMLGSVLSDNLMTLYAFWELTSVSSFLLIAYWYQRKRSRYGAQKALLITVTGGFAMLLGFLLLYQASGTFSIREMIGMADQIADHALFIPAMLLILLGAFTKSAQFPFHIWLPDAMEAPTPISAYLHSATMVKAGIYLVARFTPIFGGHMVWFWVIVITGIVTLFWAAFMAIRQSDLKALLAFSTISQLGLIMCLLGIGSLALHPQYTGQTMLFSAAVLAAVFHLVNHSVFKGTLFMVIGILDHETGTRDTRRLGGLISIMPVSFTLCVIGAFSMAGLPPFSGFISKEMFFTGVLNTARHLDAWMVWLPILAWVASILTFVYCMIIVFQTFTGPYQPELLDRKPREASFGMLIAPIVLAGITIVLFIFPNLLTASILEPAVRAIVPQAFASGDVASFNLNAWHGWNLELLMTLGIVVLGALMYLNAKKWTGIYDNLPRSFTLNNAYDRGLTGIEHISARITGSYMTGFIAHYLSYIFVFLIVVVGGAWLWSQAFTFDLSANAAVRSYEFLLGFVIVAAALLVMFTTSRLTAIIATSVVGFIVASFFVILRAPDLALTQLVVETISTTLFLLCFYFLPKLKKELRPARLRVTNIIISLGVGITFTVIGLSVQGHRLFEPIAYFFEDSYTLTGARNMVNAILVDFRGFDTMLEIVVLFTAGIGVYTLINLRQSRRNER